MLIVVQLQLQSSCKVSISLAVIKELHNIFFPYGFLNMCIVADFVERIKIIYYNQLCWGKSRLKWTMRKSHVFNDVLYRFQSN